MRNKKGLLLVICLICTFILVGCSSKSITLEEYVKKDKNTMESINNIGDSSDMKITIKDNSLIYVYDISGMSQITEDIAKSDSMKEALEESLNNTSSTFTNLCDSLVKETGISDINIIVKYSYKETPIFEKTFTSTNK